MLAVIEDQPNQDVTTYTLCQRVGGLPYPGGLYNQPAHLVDRWILIENARVSKRKLDEGASDR